MATSRQRLLCLAVLMAQPVRPACITELRSILILWSTVSIASSLIKSWLPTRPASYQFWLVRDKFEIYPKPSAVRPSWVVWWNPIFEYRPGKVRWTCWMIFLRNGLKLPTWSRWKIKPRRLLVVKLSSCIHWQVLRQVPPITIVFSVSSES